MKSFRVLEWSAAVTIAAMLPVLFVSGQVTQRTTLTEARPIQFDEVTTDAGIEFHLRSGTLAKRYLIEVMAGGVAFIDVDDDGWIDLYFVNGSSLEEERRGERREPNRLYRNRGDGTFANVTDQAGVGGRYWGMGVCTGDVNNDGWDDLYVTNVGPNLLYLNNGNGTFSEAGATSGTNHRAWSSSCAFADADGDADLDLYVSNYLVYNLDDPPVRTNGGDRCIFRGLPGVEVACGPLGLTPAPDRFYENRGDGTFLDATASSGMTRVPPAYGLGVVWGDYDDDGDQDLYVANDEMPNFLFRNDGGGQFTEVGLITGVALTLDGRVQGGMGSDFGDVDNDGDLDLIVTNFVDDYNTLYRNDGNGTFLDGTQQSAMIGPAMPYVGWGVTFVDLDLDGRLDIPVANGHLYPQLDQISSDEPRLFSDVGSPNFLGGLGGLPTPSGRGYLQRNQLFQSTGGGRFTEVGEIAGVGFRLRDSSSSRGLAAGDINNDGLVDLVITHLDETPSVLLNRSQEGNWLLLDLRTTVSNRSAIGAVAFVRIGDLVLRRDVRSGGGYQSQHDRRLHFGLGEHTRIDELTIRWPSGQIDRRWDLDANRILVIREDP
jgi:hypothetical protein